MMGMACGLMAAGALAGEDRALLEISPMFGDHAVLQREMPVPVWGWGTPGATVMVVFARQQKTITTGEDGKWLVKRDHRK